MIGGASLLTQCLSVVTCNIDSIYTTVLTCTTNPGTIKQSYPWGMGHALSPPVINVHFPGG